MVEFQFIHLILYYYKNPLSFDINKINSICSINHFILKIGAINEKKYYPSNFLL